MMDRQTIKVLRGLSYIFPSLWYKKGRIINFKWLNMLTDILGYDIDISGYAVYP